MTHLYTRGSEYALRALQEMAVEPDRRWTVADICEHVAIPEQFTRKVLQSLVRSGILTSIRGPGGGYSFAIPPETISLSSVIVSVESGPRFDLCILGYEHCSDLDPCPLHYFWAPIKNSALAMLKERTVADLAKEPRRRKQ
ncbi:MAG: Rrf2 family transcriptional regulator [Planctomycetota bacterium]